MRVVNTYDFQDFVVREGFVHQLALNTSLVRPDEGFDGLTVCAGHLADWIFRCGVAWRQGDSDGVALRIGGASGEVELVDGGFAHSCTIQRCYIRIYSSGGSGNRRIRKDHLTKLHITVGDALIEHEAD